MTRLPGPERGEGQEKPRFRGFWLEAFLERNGEKLLALSLELERLGIDKDRMARILRLPETAPDNHPTTGGIP